MVPERRGGLVNGLIIDRQLAGDVDGTPGRRRCRRKGQSLRQQIQAILHGFTYEGGTLPMGPLELVGGPDEEIDRAGQW